MMQQVNLYQPILRRQEKVFSATAMLQGNMIVLLALALLYAYTVVQTGTMQQRLGEVQQQRNEQARQLAELTQRYPVRQKDQGLAARIAQAEAELTHKRQLLAAVGQLGLAEGGGFSDHLAALARQDLPQLWLSHIQLGYGQQVELSGSALQADDVPFYLQRLGAEPSFSGTAFRSVVIARNEGRPGRVEFLLSSRGEEER